MPDIDPALPPSLREAAPSTLDDADRYLMWGMLVDAAEALVLGAEDPWRDDEVLVTEIRDWVFADSNLQRFFDRYFIGERFVATI